MNPTHKKIIQIIVGIIVLVILIISIRHSRVSDSGSVATTTPGTATSSQMQVSSTVSGAPTLTPIMPSQSATTSTAEINLPKAIIYGVSMDKPSYKQDEQIRITLAIINNTDAAVNYSFANGCQGNYVIDSFDLSAHIRCTESPTAFRVLPHTTQNVKLVHYPSIYKIPVGTHKLTVNVVGYPGVSTSVTITAANTAAK